MVYLYSPIIFSNKRNELLVCAKTWINHENHYAMKEAKKKKKEYVLNDSTYIKFQNVKANL